MAHSTDRGGRSHEALSTGLFERAYLACRGVLLLWPELQVEPGRHGWQRQVDGFLLSRTQYEERRELEIK